MTPLAPLSDSSSTLPLPNTHHASSISAASAYQKIKNKTKTGIKTKSERGASKWMDELKRDALAAVGELVGTCAFLFLALGGAKTALATQDLQSAAPDNATIMFISVCFGLSLLVTVWSFYRVTGGLFNPAVTLALWMCGCVGALRASLLAFAQLLGGIIACALLSALTPGDVTMVENRVASGVSVVQALFTEALLTAVLVFTVLMLAAEKHRSTHLAPLGVGLTVFVCHLFGIPQTGCGINPARSFGPAVLSGHFDRYHWVYWIGPLLGSVFSTVFYKMLHAVDYQLIVAGQDADCVDPSSVPPQDVFSKVYKQARQWNGNLIFYLDSKAAAEACIKQQQQQQQQQRDVQFGDSANASTRVDASATAGMGQASSVQVYNETDAAQTEAVRCGQAVVLNINDYPTSLFGTAAGGEGAAGGAGVNFSNLSLGLPLAPMTNATHRTGHTHHSFFNGLSSHEEIRALMLQQQQQQQQQQGHHPLAHTALNTDRSARAVGTMSACMQDLGAIAPPGSTRRT